MEFKGTKGKWIFNQEEMKIKGSGDIEGLTVIANVSAKMDFSIGIGIQIANALLISKAPEMLEALKDFIQAVETEEIIINENYDNDGFENCGSRLISNFKKLIKEATTI